MIADILITLFLVLLNGFFVAAEFAIVKVRYSQIEIKIQQGSRIAKTARSIVDNLDTYLSATQLGITLASLGLGWIGEPVVSSIITNSLAAFHIELDAETTHKIALPIAFILITTLHIVLGELAPKSIAIRKAEQTTYVISIPLKVFFYIFKPFIWLMNSISNFLLKMIGIQPIGEHDIHSSDELRILVEQSKDGGAIEEADYKIIKNAFEFNDLTAKQIMIPRQQIFAIDVDTPPDELIEQVVENGYSRVPVYHNSIDNITGIVHVKELLKMHYQKLNYSIAELQHPPLYFVETQPISDLLKQFQSKHVHMAVVVDEFGGTAGIITLEDVLEELVGEIQDEDDNEIPLVIAKDDGSYIVQATQPLSNINDHIQHPFELNDNYQTLSGLIFNSTGHIPKQGEIIFTEGYEITITKIQNRSIQTVVLKYIDSKHNSVTD